MRSWACAIAVVIAGCGGGGDGGSSSDEFTVGASTPSAIVETYSNAPVGGKTVQLSAPYTGTLSGKVYVFVQDPDGIIGTADIFLPSKNVVTLELGIGDVPVPGHFTKPLVVQVCHDAACASPYGGFPRSIAKDITFNGTTANVSALHFSSTAGVRSPIQAIGVAAPPDASFFFYDDYLNATASALRASDVFSLTKTATGFDVYAKPASQGRYAGKLTINTPGYASIKIDVDYDVGPPVTPVITLLSGPVNVSAPARSSVDVTATLDFAWNMGKVNDGTLSFDPAGGTVAPSSTHWVRIYGGSVDGSGATSPDGLVEHMPLRFNPCLGGISCLPAGTYTANLEYKASAYGSTTTATVPITFTITP